MEYQNFTFWSTYLGVFQLWTNSNDLLSSADVVGTYEKIGVDVHPPILTPDMITAIKKCVENDHNKYFKDIVNIMINGVQNQTLDETYKMKYGIELREMLSNHAIKYAGV